MAKQKLDRFDLISIAYNIQVYIEYMKDTEVSGANTHLYKSLVLVLLNIRVKVANKLITLMHNKGCTIKLTEIELNTLFHFRNELHLTGVDDNGIVRLLSMNTK